MFSVLVQDIHKYYKNYNRPVDRLIEAIIRKPRHKFFTALNGISFSLSPNQSLGIIGNNGVGKSTLLKILAGTLTPSQGQIEMSGRVAALLELGAGFHPEFTGRQNIFLNASLLGISKKEIISQEEDIIAFSELNEFIDRPVKTYSSGMYVRLAFSIATSVNPDILIIDEALSVGDIAFQRKCTDRMNLFREQGKTMIFCSHSMYHVRELCDRTMWIENGAIRSIGSTDEVVANYEELCRNKKSAVPSNLKQQIQHTKSPEDCRIIQAGIEDENANPTDTITPLTNAYFTMKVEILNDDVSPQFGFALLLPDESFFSASMTHHDKIDCGPYQAGQKINVRLHVEYFPIREGTYRLLAAVAEKSGLLWYEYTTVSPVKIKVEQGMGIVTFKRKWHIEQND
ncbi:polysaccharide ABC transporter ATP-binding protein [Desulfobacterales bacterium HSG17]|nr:polysaccharide ABC transporter ATP-binding protein [Desulfobacterales bacterium HSG17]